jgi:hypothetical protein
MIVSTTLTGSNADIIGDALASVVAQVDRCLVIDTGARDESIDVARRVAGTSCWCVTEERLLRAQFRSTPPPRRVLAGRSPSTQTSA